MFLIESAMETMANPRRDKVFDPFPSYFLQDPTKAIKMERGNVLHNQKLNAYKDFAKLDRVRNQLNLIQLEQTLNTVPNDTALRLAIGNDPYRLVRFIVTSCKVDLKQTQIDGMT